MELLAFMSANPVLSVFIALILSGLLVHVLNIVRDFYVNTIWCIRGIPPVFKVIDKTDIDALDAAVAKVTLTKKENDENKLKDCR